MYKFLVTLLTILFGYTVAYSQASPKEGSRLNYRLIGFSFPIQATDASYSVEIAGGNDTTAEQFKTNLLKTVPAKKSRVIAEVPFWGRDYTWRTVTTDKSAVKSYGALRHFSTLSAPDVDTALVRLRIIDSAKGFKDAYVLLDANGAMYDMKGQAVWFLLRDNSAPDPNRRDLKVTPFGTVTFISNDDAFEVNYAGDTTWRAPNDGSVSGGQKENYHHEFTRLANGHYMTMGNERVYGAPSSAKDSGLFRSLKKKSELTAIDTDMAPVMFGTIVEYDERGSVVWSWKSSDYFKNSDLRDYKPKDAMGNIAVIDMHENAFYFDEQEKVVYVSFKNISRIVKLKYPEGTVLNEYGEKYRSGIAPKGNGLFCGQHACKRGAIGCLFLFNNNGCNPGELPKIKKLAEPKNDSGGLKKIWEYTCAADKNAGTNFPMGGNIVELPEQAVFACMGSLYSKVFIVDDNKKLVWSALPEKWNAEEKRWKPSSQYRASIIYDRAMLERMIWNTEQKPKKGS